MAVVCHAFSKETCIRVSSNKVTNLSATFKMIFIRLVAFHGKSRGKIYYSRTVSQWLFAMSDSRDICLSFLGSTNQNLSSA